MVLCHADVHTGNILLTAGGRMYVVDWDDTMLAPKERDLMFVLADTRGREWDAFVAGYGQPDMDATTLAFYQHHWCVEDIGAFAVEILDTDSAGAGTRMNSLSWFKSLFAPGGSVASALANEIDLLPARNVERAAGGPG